VSVDVVLADVVLVAHLAYLVYLPVGPFIAWHWPRTIWLHAACLAVAIVSITIGFDCPLTSWEQSLRRAGGQRAYTDGFVDHYLAGKVFPHGDAWVVQVVFGVCIVVGYAGYFARRRSRRAPVDELRAT
jgi:hypothetical protein